MGYRYITLTPSEVILIEAASKISNKEHFRDKCETILLSYRGYDIKSLSDLFQVRKHTIRSWMDSWEAKGLAGFYISVGRGRKAEIQIDNIALVNSIKSAVALNPQSLQTVCQELNQSNGINLTKDKLIRFLKKS